MKVLPWVFAILALLAFWACIEVGWLYSLLTIGIVSCILCAVYSLYMKSEKSDATEKDKTVASITTKVVVGIAGCLIFFGLVIGAAGLFNPKTDGYKMETCGWCGGDGTNNSGERCSVCNGSGGAVFENTVYDDITFIGILIVASGVVLIVGVGLLKYKINTMHQATDENAVQVNLPVGKCLFWLGHWKDGVENSEWIVNKPDASGAWGIRLRFIYEGVESFRKSYYYLIPYDKNGNSFAPERTLSCSNYQITPDTRHLLWWDGLWKGKDVDHVKITKIEIIHDDGESQVFDT